LAQPWALPDRSSNARGETPPLAADDASNIDEVARVGYADANTLRKLLTQQMNASPRELRARVS
jgi:hypothetical protein